jgi:hypothetical protein
MSDVSSVVEIILRITRVYGLQRPIQKIPTFPVETVNSSRINQTYPMLK